MYEQRIFSRGLQCLLVTALLLPSVAAAAISSAERAALLALYDGTNGPQWTQKSGWGGAPGTECDWYGVSCDAARTQVWQLRLHANNLVGPLPAEIAGLLHLTSLWLYNNKIQGTLIPELGDLANLQWLLLSKNELTGTIPSELGQLSQLQRLDLRDNDLSGSIPPEFTQLTELRNLDLRLNRLSTLSPELGSLPKLQTLNLSKNQLTGALPPELGQLSELQYLFLEENHLSGTVPPELGSLTELRTLTLYKNQLSGSLPPELGNLSSLYRLSLNNNGFTGTIPPQFGNMSQLGNLELYHNQLSGSIPAQLGNLTRLLYLDLSANDFSGAIPPELGNLVLLRQLHLNANQLSGPIPPELGNLSQVQRMNLGYNQLSGSIPPQLGNLAEIVELHLHKNQLSGAIPPELGNLLNLRKLYLNENDLSGSIPPQLGNLSRLYHLYLWDNRLSGTLPASFGNLSELYQLYVQGNALSGPLPTELQGMTGLNAVNLRWNRLWSEDPALTAFLDAKSTYDWQETQTLAPTDVAAGAPSETSVSLSWTPITYKWDDGGYDVYYSTTSGGPYAFSGSTVDKWESSLAIEGLAPNTTYFLVVRTRTEPHVNNKSRLVSDPSTEVNVTTLGEPVDPEVEVTAFDAGNGDHFGHAVALSGTTLVVGAFAASKSGSAYVSERNAGGTGAWGTVKKLAASDAANGDRFGHAVSIDATTTAIAAPRDDGRGSVYLFERDAEGAGNWGEVKKLTASDTDVDDNFGYAVALNATVLAVGSPWNDEMGVDSGAVYVFGRDVGGPGNWGLVKKITAADGAADAQFGFSVALDGSTLAVGAWADDDAGTDSGAVYVFERDAGGAGNWGQVRKLVGADTDSADLFGSSVALDTTTLVVGATRADSATEKRSGAIYIFERDAGGVAGWGQVEKLTAADPKKGADFGHAVSLDGERLVTSAIGDDEGGKKSGALYVFEHDTVGEGHWPLTAKLLAADSGAGDQLGFSVAIDGPTIAAGAPYTDGDGNKSGSVYIFQ